MKPLAAIVAAVALEYGLTPRDLTGPSRTKTRVQARVAAIGKMRAQGASLREIGEALGYREARTVLYHLRKGLVDNLFIK